MSEVEVEVLTRQEAEDSRAAILAQVGDEQKFRERGEDYQLDADEIILYNELLVLEYLLYG